MKLSVKFLENVCDVNNFQYADLWDIQEGSVQNLYFQIVDLHKDSLRYMTQATVYSASATFLDINDLSEFTKTATQPFADDKSIWLIQLSATEVPNSGAVKFNITEDGVVSQFRVEQAISVDLLSAGGC